MTSRPSAKRRQPGHRLFAAFYDPMTRVGERRIIGGCRHELLAGLSGSVLEIGVGTGANFPYYSSAAEVIGIEPDQFMLRRAEAKLARSGKPAMALRRGSAEEIPFPDQAFDRVVSTLVLCTVQDQLQALAEIARVLKPGGSLHIIEHVRGEGILGRLQDGIRPGWQAIAGGCVLNRRTGEALQRAGFGIGQLRTHRLLFGVPLLVGTARRP